jgi:peptide/nickel transport system substrate-binding protein
MSSKTYWQKFTDSRVDRRRALTLAGGAGAGLAALGLAGCGSGSGYGGQNKGSSAGSGLTVSLAQDTTAQAKPGGVIKNFFQADILHFDALLSNSSSTVNDVSVFTYPRLLKYTLVPAGKLNDGSMVEGDLMESYEVSPDKLTLTFKMRQGLKWDPKAPTGGRVIDAQDVLFSWKKFGTVNASAVNLVYDAQKAPTAAVESVTSPDDKTIVMKLRQPDGALLTLLAGWDQLYIMPREADGGFDP